MPRGVLVCIGCSSLPMPNRCRAMRWCSECATLWSRRIPAGRLVPGDHSCSLMISQSQAKRAAIPLRGSIEAGAPDPSSKYASDCRTATPDGVESAHRVDLPSRPQPRCRRSTRTAHDDERLPRQLRRPTLTTERAQDRPGIAKTIRSGRSTPSPRRRSDPLRALRHRGRGFGIVRAGRP